MPVYYLEGNRGRPFLADLEALKQCLHLFVLKIFTIVRYNGRRKAITTNDVIHEKFGNLHTSDISKRNNLYPFCKILIGSDNVIVAIRGSWCELPYEIESPF